MGIGPIWGITSLNIRSPPKNLCLLNDILLTIIIHISETGLSVKNVYYTSITGYEFISKASKAKAGGVGMYMKDTLNFIKRHDLEKTLDGPETCLIELLSVKQSHIIMTIIGCICICICCIRLPLPRMTPAMQAR